MSSLLAPVLLMAPSVIITMYALKSLGRLKALSLFIRFYSLLAVGVKVGTTNVGGGRAGLGSSVNAGGVGGGVGGSV